MKRLAIAAVGLALVVGTAAIFAVWPVVGGAPWLPDETDSPPASKPSLLSEPIVIEAVKWHVVFWCANAYGTEDTREKCAEERIRGTCEDREAWVVSYEPDRQVWRVSCGGWQYSVDDTTGAASSPYMPGLSGVGRIEQRLSRLKSKVSSISAGGWRLDDLESRLDELESCLSPYPSRFCSNRLNDIEQRLNNLEWQLPY